MSNPKVSLVTGASSGIGAATAQRLAARGDTVIVHCNADTAGGQQTLESVCAAGGGGHSCVQADLTDGAGVDSLMAHIRDTYGQFDTLVNNAGALLKRFPVAEATRQSVEVNVALNLTSAILVASAALPLLRPESASIVNVTSVASYNGGGGGSAVYAAAKGGIVSFTRSLAKEVAPRGVRVNAISPGVVATRFHDRYTTPDMLAAMITTIPMGRVGTAAECADLIEFLTGSASTYITGQVIHINGGQFLG